MRISTRLELPTVSIQNGRPIWRPICTDSDWSSSEKNGFGPVGIQPLKALPSLPLAAETRPAAERISVRPVSSVLMSGFWAIGLWRGDQAIADAAHRLQEEGIGRIALDLAAQPVDLHVDGALVHAAVAGQCAARHGLARRHAEDAQHLALAVGEMDDLLALAQFAAAEVID